MIVGAAAIGADRQTAADDLAQRGEVGSNLPERLRAAVGHAKAGHHFVADQQRAVLARSARSSASRKAVEGTTQPMLPTTGSKITPAIREPCSVERCFQGGRIVVAAAPAYRAPCPR